jgi:Flp pilus assembly protein TadG
MKLPWRRNEVSRGQALVEFAIVLPVIALLLVMALDFGRVYFGWISLNNAARVGANYASSHADAWSAGRTAEQDAFTQLVRDNVSGCTLVEPLASPQFIDMNADGDREGSSDQVNVTLNCSFDLITPLASTVMGSGAINVAAESVFPVRGQYDGPTGAGGNPPCAGIRAPDLRLRTVADAQQLWTDLTFTGSFTVDPTGEPDYIIQTQTFTPNASPNDCVDASTQVFVRAVPPPPCPSGQAQVPNLMNMTLTDARLAWTAATFTGTFTPANGNNAKVVLTQTTTPSSVPNGCLATTATVVVTYGDPPPPQCTVPNMVGHTVSEAQNMWAANNFTRTLNVTGNGNGTVSTQDPGFPGTVNCDIRGRINT